jgi:hypothetical protein
MKKPGTGPQCCSVKDIVGASLLAMDSIAPRVIQQARVIVGDHREQARSYKGLTEQH